MMGIVLGIISIVGIYGFFTGSLMLVIIGGLAGAFENIVGVMSGQQKSLFTAIVAIIIGVLYATNLGLPIWFGVLIGLTFENAIMGFFGLVLLMFVGKKARDYNY